MTTLVAQNFDSFVFAQNDDIKTTSLLVAEKFNKLHKDVLRKIQTLERLNALKILLSAILRPVNTKTNLANQTPCTK